MIGALRHQVVIQAEAPTADGGGGSTLAWTDVATAWARIEPLSGTERLHAGQLEDGVTHRITLRHRTGLTAKHRFKFGTRTFNVRAVIDRDERRRWLDVMAEEGVAT